MTFTKGQRVKVQLGCASALEDVGAPEECEGECGTILDDEDVYCTPPQIEVQFDAEIDGQREWFVPVECLEALP